MNTKDEFNANDRIMALFDGLLKNAIEESKKNVGAIIPYRVKEVYSAKEDFDALLADNDDAESELKFHPAFCSASLVAKVDDLDIYKKSKDRLRSILEKADTFAVVPLTNGKIEVSFTFQEVLAVIGSDGDY